MQNGRILGIVPARLGSQRLPGKPLVEIGGRPLIEWVWRRVSAFSTLDACVVATDAAEVAEVCRSFGAVVAMTSPEHPSGTDRVAEVAALATYSGYEIIVNVQGDEPLIEEGHVAGAVAEVRRGMDIGTVATPIRDSAALADPGVVKVTRRSNGAALYFSRSAIPFRRDGAPSETDLSTDLYLRHVGVYAFSPASLRRWVSLPICPLEETERLEQLRPLAAGMTIGVGIVESAEGGVDTPADVARITARLKQLEAEPTSAPEREP